MYLIMDIFWLLSQLLYLYPGPVSSYEFIYFFIFLLLVLLFIVICHLMSFIYDFCSASVPSQERKKPIG